MTKPMTHTKRDRSRLRQALRLAIDYQASTIDAHRVGLCCRKGQMVSVIPKHYRTICRRWQRDIEAFRRLLKRLHD